MSSLQIQYENNSYLGNKYNGLYSFSSLNGMSKKLHKIFKNSDAVVLN